jgi:hypothetical protein
MNKQNPDRWHVHSGGFGRKMTQELSKTVFLHLNWLGNRTNSLEAEDQKLARICDRLLDLDGGNDLSHG